MGTNVYSAISSVKCCNSGIPPFSFKNYAQEHYKFFFHQTDETGTKYLESEGSFSGGSEKNIEHGFTRVFIRCSPIVVWLEETKYNTMWFLFDLLFQTCVE